MASAHFNAPMWVYTQLFYNIFIYFLESSTDWASFSDFFFLFFFVAPMLAGLFFCGLLYTFIHINETGLFILKNRKPSVFFQYTIDDVNSFFPQFSMYLFLQIVVCGDVRGNLILFPLSKDLLLGRPITTGIKTIPTCYFKGAHGISTVTSVVVARLESCQTEIHSVLPLLFS